MQKVHRYTKNNEHPSHSLLRVFNQAEYDSFRNKCFRERRTMGVGKSQNMNTLFRFWSYYLRTNTNAQMYTEFKNIAEEDYEMHYKYGSECLFRCWSYGLENEFSASMYSDFEHSVIRQYKYTNGMETYGLEKMWAFHYYRKDERVIRVNDEIQALLDSNFTQKLESLL